MTMDGKVRIDNSEEAIIKKRMSEYLKSSDFDPYFSRLHPDNTRLWTMALFAPLTIVGMPLAKAAWKKILAGDCRTKRLRRRYASLADRGEVIFTYVVVANSTLKYQEDSNAPALVVGNFNDGKNDLEIIKLRKKFAGAALGVTDDPNEEDLAELLGDLDYTFKRRREIPKRHSGGLDVTAFDLQITGEFLPTRKLQVATIPCLAEPGKKGLICMIPFFLIDDVFNTFMQKMTTGNINVDLLLACYNRDPVKVELLLKAGADPNYKIPDNEENPIVPGRKGSAEAVFFATGPDACCDTMVDLLVQYGAIIPHHYKWHLKRNLQRSAFYHLVRQGVPVDYRDYWWAEKNGFENVLDALRDRNVKSIQPVYDVDEMLSSRPSWSVIYDLYKLIECDELEPLPSVNIYEKTLYEAYEIMSCAVNGLEDVLQNENDNFAFAYSKIASLKEVGATRACEILNEIRSLYRSLGAEVELEDETCFGESLADAQEEVIINYASKLSGDFMHDLNTSIERWFAENIRHFQARKLT